MVRRLRILLEIFKYEKLEDALDRLKTYPVCAGLLCFEGYNFSPTVSAISFSLSSVSSTEDRSAVFSNMLCSVSPFSLRSLSTITLRPFVSHRFLASSNALACSLALFPSSSAHDLIQTTYEDSDTHWLDIRKQIDSWALSA
ncbi:unnamed protein product [Cochlearia groenlandica]